MDPKYSIRKRAFALAVAGVACTSLSGCVNELMLAYFGASSLYLYTHPEATEEDWSEVRTQREPQAEMVQYRHDVEFSPGEFTMSSAEGQRLSSFLTRVDVGYGDTVVLMAEPAEGAGVDTASRLTERRASTVSDFLAINRVDATEPAQPRRRIAVHQQRGDGGRSPPRGRAAGLPGLDGQTRR